MSEVEQLRVEVAELREAVLHLAHAQSQARDCALQADSPDFFVKNPERIYAAVSSALYALNKGAHTQPLYDKAEWMKKLQRRSGMNFSAWRTLKYAPMVAASRKATA